MTTYAPLAWTKGELAKLAAQIAEVAGGEHDAAYWKNEYETAQDGVNELRQAIAKARDLIGNHAGDLTGAALDAWAILENAYPANAEN